MAIVEQGTLCLSAIAEAVWQDLIKNMIFPKEWTGKDSASGL
jgi:hypothetical protein